MVLPRIENVVALSVPIPTGLLCRYSQQSRCEQ